MARGTLPQAEVLKCRVPLWALGPYRYPEEAPGALGSWALGRIGSGRAGAVRDSSRTIQSIRIATARARLDQRRCREQFSNLRNSARGPCSIMRRSWPLCEVRAAGS